MTNITNMANSKYIDVCLNSVINNVKIQNSIIQEIFITQKKFFNQGRLQF